MNKKIFKLLVFLGLLFLFIGCGGSDGTTNTGKATITGQYKLGDKPTGTWDGIQIMVTGRENFTITTQADGQFSVNVDPANYTIQASKNGYDVSSDAINASSEGRTYDLGIKILQTTTPPAPPF